MAGRRGPPELTMDDSVLYLTSVKKTFHDEPAKFNEFLKVLNDIKAHRINKDSGIARMTELIKGHSRLLPGLSVFLPKAKITIPPKDDKGLRQFQTLDYIELPPALYTANEHAYIASVKEAFHDEPAKYKEWKNIYLDYKARRIDETGVIARWEKVLKDHRSLLIRFSALLPPGAKITIPPEAEQQNTRGNKKRKYAESNGADYMNKIEERKMKGKNESPLKKKMKLSKRTIHCKKCGQAGHNSRSCDKHVRQAKTKIVSPETFGERLQERLKNDKKITEAIGAIVLKMRSREMAISAAKMEIAALISISQEEDLLAEHKLYFL